MPFSNKKYKESKQYDISPIILPVFHEPDDGDDDNGSNHSDDDVEMISNHNVDNDDDVVLSECLSVCLYVWYSVGIKYLLALLYHRSSFFVIKIFSFFLKKRKFIT